MTWNHASLGLAGVLLLATIGFGTEAGAAGTCDGRPCIKIGSYNIERLGAGKSNDDHRKMDKVVERLAAFDVVVLQEINKTDEKSDAWKVLKARLRAEGLEVVAEGEFGGADPDRQQFVMILADPDEVEVVSDSAINLPIPTENPSLGPGCKYRSLRQPVSVLLRAGKFDFRLVGVHLKSQVWVGTEEQCDDDIRRWQAKEIVKHLEGLQATDKEADVIVVGDFNSPFSEKEFDPLRHAGFVSLIPEDCRPEEDQIGCTHVVRSVQPPHPPGAIDHIAVPRGMEESAGDGEIGTFTGSVDDYRKFQSDHLPVWAEFYTDRDDD